MVKRTREVHRNLKRIKVEVENESLLSKNYDGQIPIEIKNEKNIQIDIKEELKNNTLTGQTVYGDLDKPERKLAPNIFKYAKQTTEGPANWTRIYNEVVKMRSKITTPVDTQGCERMPNSISPGIQKRDPKRFRFQLLISLMLSSQTKDEINFAAMMKLESFFKNFGGLCIEGILATSEKQIDELIRQVGFHNRKAAYIKRTCEILMETHEGDVPKTIEEITSLPGIGPKMGYLLLQNAWNLTLGIGVDVHLHRLAQAWGWVRKSNNPETTRADLESWLPREYWADINPLMVGFGQVVCVPRASNCDVCYLSHGLCKSRNRKLRLPLTEERIVKLNKQRGDLSALIADAANKDW